MDRIEREHLNLLQVLDLSSVRLVYSSSYFKSLSTGGNVSKALVNKFRKSSINLPPGGGGCLCQTHLRGGLIQTGGAYLI